MKKWVRNLLIILGAIVFLFVLAIIGNCISNAMLVKYIDSFETIEYPQDRIVPVMEDGHYTITTDDDLRIMHITDIHIGGGFYTYKNDKKSIYETITMLQKEKPDIVILGGDNTYCVPGIGFNGGFTINNRRVAKTVIKMFTHEGVYFTTVFGNHDTEAFDLANRQEIGELYMNDETGYCFFNEEFSDLDAETVPSVTNQIVVVKNTDGEIRKLLLLIDSNAYMDTRFITSAYGKYDVVHDAQLEWAKESIGQLSKESGLSEGEYLKSLCFLHIPMGEYKLAMDDLLLSENGPENTEYIRGVWDEDICYAGRWREDVSLDALDNTFEVLCEEMNSVEGFFCGHDHVNNALVKYKGVVLNYGYSIDNEAYGDKIMHSGLQRGATIITVSKDGSFDVNHKNAYIDYGISTDLFTDIYLDRPLYPERLRAY